MVEANEVSEALWSLLTARVSSVFFALSRSRPYRHARPRPSLHLALLWHALTGSAVRTDAARGTRTAVR